MPSIEVHQLGTQHSLHNQSHLQFVNLDNLDNLNIAVNYTIKSCSTSFSCTGKI